jgi:hypothetical protein
MDATLLSQFLTTLIGLGPGGVIAAMSYFSWREERAERRALQEQVSKLIELKIQSDNALATALEKLAEKVTAK